ncbi:MAG TPA: Sua5/YciO/YrdC/YwlC family protein, partial [Candidatus Sumerlaeota bacterium]|nr:Sua5/YciO/YrdC/YwlC family protein [Candidatus Sumerlaeota bacterium]
MGINIRQKKRRFVIVHIAEKRDITLAATDIPELAYLLAEKFWPGPLTLVLQRHARVAPSVSAGLGTVAV